MTASIVRIIFLAYGLLIGNCLFQTIHACTKDGLTDAVAGSNGGTGLNGLLGGDIQDVPHDDNGADGDVISDPSDLDCDDFDDCRWHNVGSEEDDVDWRLAEGEPDEDRLNDLTGEDTYSGSPSLVAFPDDSLDSDEKAFYVSDPVLCQSGTGELSFSHYNTDNTDLKVCQRLVGEIEPDACTTVRGSGSSTVDIEGADTPFEILFYASGFESDQEFVIIDDIRYDAQLCDLEDENLFATTEGFPEEEGGFDDTVYCDMLQCDFNPGTGCSNNAGNNGPRGWQTVQGRCGNRNTGIVADSAGNQQGSYACLSGPVTSEEVIAFTNIELGEPKLLLFRWYKASYQAIFKVLVNGEEIFVNDETINSDREWKDGEVFLPAGNNEIAFVGDNLQANHYLGVDDLELLDQNGQSFC